jgi:hypothetical protein
MLRRDVYFKAFQAGAHLRKKWVISAFSVVRNQGDDKPWDFRYERDKTLTYAQTENGLEWQAIEDVVPMTPLFKSMEPLSVKAGEVPNLSKDVETTYGDVLFNWRVLVYAFGSKFDYRLGPIKVKAIEKEIAKNMVDDPLSEDDNDDSKLYVRDYLKFGLAISDLAGFTQLFVPTATERSLQTHPDARKRRDELLEQNKDRLHDPAIVAEIQNELIAMDKSYIKGDPSEGFFLNDKVWNTARKRMFLIHGPEAGFDEGGDAELVVNSLNEGWDIGKLPAMVNSLRAGSYYRGKLTALGGESVKFFLRVFQNTYISEKDCGTPLTIEKIVSAGDNDLIGSYYVGKNGIDLISAETLTLLNGQKLAVRTPLYCRTSASDYCETCMGAHNSENPTGLGSGAADVGSTFMSVMMASAHAKELKTARLKVDTFLS